MHFIYTFRAIYYVGGSTVEGTDNSANLGQLGKFPNGGSRMQLITGVNDNAGQPASDRSAYALGAAHDGADSFFGVASDGPTPQFSKRMPADSFASSPAESPETVRFTTYNQGYSNLRSTMATATCPEVSCTCLVGIICAKSILYLPNHYSCACMKATMCTHAIKCITKGGLVI